MCVPACHGQATVSQNVTDVFQTVPINPEIARRGVSEVMKVEIFECGVADCRCPGGTHINRLRPTGGRKDVAFWVRNDLATVALS